MTAAKFVTPHFHGEMPCSEIEVMFARPPGSRVSFIHSANIIQLSQDAVFDDSRSSATFAFDARVILLKTKFDRDCIRAEGASGQK